MTWEFLLGHWSLLEADLADRGVDLEDPRVLHGRSWRWLRTRILGVVNAPTLAVLDGQGNVHAHPTTRVGLALEPPTYPRAARSGR